MSTSPKPSRHTCPDCGRSYKAAETLNRHRKNHSETTAYTCDICDASFKRKDLLDRHSNIHSNGRQPTSRNRSQRACDRCSRLKTRCDNLVPCTRCTRGGHACTYRLKSSRARTDRSSTVSIDTAPSSRSSMDLSGPEMFQQPQVQLQEDWQGLWQESNLWQWPNVDPSAPLQQPSDLVPASACALPNSLSPWTGNIDPMLMEPPTLSPFHSVDSDPGSPCSGSSIEQWTTAELQPSLTVPAFDEIDLSPAITPYQQSMYAPPHFDYTSLPEPAFEDPKVQNILTTTTPVQQKLINELATLASNFAPALVNPASRARLWTNAAQKVQQTFNIPSVAGSTHIFLTFLNLFFKHFTTSCLPSEKRFAAAESHQPHLYLTMIAIGAAYAGPAAEIFSHGMLEALRPRLTNAARGAVLKDDEIVPLIQSLALLQAAMLNFDQDRHHCMLPASQRLNEAMIGLCRRIGLFETTRSNNCIGMVEAEERRKLAIAVVKLDETIGVFTGILPLLSDEETRAQWADRKLPHARTPAAELRCSLFDWNRSSA